jgi:hypothetical protein
LLPRNSGILRSFLEIKRKKKNSKKIIKKPKRSLKKKKGKKNTLSFFEFKPRGLLEPVSCKKIK